ncbi:aminoglycoside phosphotransferase family protein [Sciscionella marina]|uniref:phosphotransferase n=1 Tax=Sciscionella marina TaxID=508770 RepID=UPI0003739944|nr:aminoglycoside phosphotransferase family protein [Sciscionella marina]
MCDKEIPLTGGMGGAVRAGATVRKTRHGERIPLLLARLRAAGFSRAPRFLGVDEHGRDVLEYLPGTVGNYPLPRQARTHTALVSAARMLRAYHDATVSLAAEVRDGWYFPPRSPVEVICHGDFAPYNCVFARGRAIGIIDFDTAHPGPRSWDVAYALYRFAPLCHPDNGDGFGAPAEQARRARLFRAHYGEFGRENIAELVADRLGALVEFMRAEAARGNAAFTRHLEDGHDRLYLRDIGYIRANAALFG